MSVIGYYRHLFATIATPTVLWRPLEIIIIIIIIIMIAYPKKCPNPY
jgi:hypothetical protein